MSQFTNEDVAKMKAMPLSKKVGIAQARIIEWYQSFGGNVYVSFSGGKDSTVMLYLVRSLLPDVPAVFVDTGLEFPEIREFVKTIDNVTWVKPKMRFDKVIEEYGFPIISKDVALIIYYAKKGSQWALNKLDGINNDGTESIFKQRYKKWKYLIDAPFKISEKCCDVIKKQPLHDYEKLTHRYAYVGTTAFDSEQRKDAWRKTGCNAYNVKQPIGKPLSPWTEQDILTYITTKDIAISRIYGNVYKTHNGSFICSGEQRTGCMFCMFGCHLDKYNRFQRMQRTHPKQWDYCINTLGLKEPLEYIGIEYEDRQTRMDI